LGQLTPVDPRNHVLDAVKMGRIHLQPGSVISRRCSLSSKLFVHLLEMVAPLLKDGAQKNGEEQGWWCTKCSKLQRVFNSSGAAGDDKSGKE